MSVRFVAVTGRPRSRFAGLLLLLLVIALLLALAIIAIPLVIVLAVVGAIAVLAMRAWALVLALLHRDGAGRRNVRVVRRDERGL